MRFSIVCPIKDEVDLIPLTLPSFYKVIPSEVVLCFDNPPHREAYKVAKAIANLYKDIPTKFLLVDKNPEYIFHQAWVRRKGFLEAKYDRILTTDIDLMINKNVHKAVEMVGKNNIGLVSLSKFEYPHSLKNFYRIMGKWVLQKIVHKFVDYYRRTGISATKFTGLYCIWRPYWLGSDEREKIKKLVNPKQRLRGTRRGRWTLDDFKAMGEDTFLRDCMIKKYKAVFLPDIGALVMVDLLEDHPDIQFSKGIYFALRGRNLIGALIRTVLRGQPYYLRGHFYGKKLLHLLSN